MTLWSPCRGHYCLFLTREFVEFCRVLRSIFAATRCKVLMAMFTFHHSISSERRVTRITLHQHRLFRKDSKEGFHHRDSEAVTGSVCQGKRRWCEVGIRTGIWAYSSVHVLLHFRPSIVRNRFTCQWRTHSCIFCCCHGRANSGYLLHSYDQFPGLRNSTTRVT